MRDYTRGRISEALAYIQKRAALSPDYLILVVDHHCANLINDLGLRQYDLITHNYFQVEDLNLGRKRYPMTDVVYMIEPS
jgi:hypothetical protein